MWQIARYYGIPTSMEDILMNLYIGISSFVRMDGKENDSFLIATGLRQGCVMSPPLVQYLHGCNDKEDNCRFSWPCCD